MTSQRICIRVTLEPDGKTPKRTVEIDGVAVAEISFVELIDLVAQAIGTFRWEQKR